MSLLIFAWTLTCILLKLLAGIFIFGNTDTNKAYQMFQSMFSYGVLLVWN